MFVVFCYMTAHLNNKSTTSKPKHQDLCVHVCISAHDRDDNLIIRTVFLTHRDKCRGWRKQQQSIGMMHHSRATRLCVCIQVTNWAINHAVPQQSYCRGAGLSLCVPHFHFLPCGAPPFSLSLHNHSLSLCVTVSLVRPIAVFSSLSRVVLALLSHLCLVTLLPLSLCILSHTDSPLIFSSNTVIISSSTSSFSSPSILSSFTILCASVSNGNKSLMFIWGTIRDRQFAQRDICLWMLMCFIHVYMLICVLYSHGFDHFMHYKKRASLTCADLISALTLVGWFLYIIHENPLKSLMLQEQRITQFLGGGK